MTETKQAYRKPDAGVIDPNSPPAPDKSTSYRSATITSSAGNSVDYRLKEERTSAPTQLGAQITSGIKEDGTGLLVCQNGQELALSTSHVKQLMAEVQALQAAAVQQSDKWISVRGFEQIGDEAPVLSDQTISLKPETELWMDRSCAAGELVSPEPTPPVETPPLPQRRDR